MIKNILLLLMLFAATQVYAVDLPISTTRPHMLLTTDRNTFMSNKKTANETSYTYTLGRMASYLSGGTYPYSTAEAAAAMALLFNIDNSLTGHRDRAIELLMDFFVETDSGHYFGLASPAVTALTAGATATDTTIAVSDTTGFSTYYNVAYIGKELVQYTGVTATTFTGCTRGYMGTTAAIHSAGDIIEYVQGTFGDGDYIRWWGGFGMLAFDWLYNDMTAQQIADFQEKVYGWGKYWSSKIGAPLCANSGFDHDSDQVLATYEILSYAGYTLYNDDDYATTLFENADGVLENLVIADYLSDQMEGGMWGEGANYSAFTVQLYMRAALINKERRLIAYDTAVDNHIDDSIKFWNYILLPGYTGFMQWSDMQTTTSDYLHLSGHNRLQLAYIMEGVASSDTSRGLARFLSAQLVSIDGEPTYAELYSGLYRLLFNDISTPIVQPTTLAKDFMSEGTRFHAMRTGWGSTDDVVYMYGHQEHYDHSHWASGHFEIVDDGVFITKEATGYGYTLVSGDTLSHNSMGIEGSRNSLVLGTSGNYSSGDSLIETFTGGSSYSFVQQELKGLYNYGGYQTENPIDTYKRRLFYLKDSAVVVLLDTVDISTLSNCSYSSASHVAAQTYACSPRNKELHQRFLALPTLSDGTYKANNEGKDFLYHPLLPTNATRIIVNESTTAPWSTAASADLPANQKKWQVITTPADSSTNPDTYLNIMHWGNTGEAMPTTTLIDIVGAVGAIIGTDVVIMSDNGVDAITSVTYNADATDHYITNLPKSSSVTVVRGGVEITGSPMDSDADGVINFSAAAGSAEYIVTAGSATGLKIIPGTGLKIIPGTGCTFR